METNSFSGCCGVLVSTYGESRGYDVYNKSNEFILSGTVAYVLCCLKCLWELKSWLMQINVYFFTLG
jgi:hypothetical protein